MRIAKYKKKKIWGSGWNTNWNSHLDCAGCPALEQDENRFCFFAATFFLSSGKGLDTKKIKQCPMNKFISEYKDAG